MASAAPTYVPLHYLVSWYCSTVFPKQAKRGVYFLKSVIANKRDSSCMVARTAHCYLWNELNMNSQRAFILSQRIQVCLLLSAALACRSLSMSDYKPAATPTAVHRDIADPSFHISSSAHFCSSFPALLGETPVAWALCGPHGCAEHLVTASF